MIARRLGRSVILLEKFKHPRFAIGESSTPLANLLLEELATRYDLPALLPLTKWGSWQQTYPEIACGLKRGFTFYHHTFGCPFSAANDRRDQLLVAASPHDGISDTHWYRADFDHFLMRQAKRAGVIYLDQVMLDRPSWHEDAVTLEGNRQGTPFSVRARFVFDATGPHGYLHRALALPEMPSENLLPTQALYTHFTEVRRLDEMRIFPTDESPPYPVDDAAVHHVFDGGWIWVLRFNNGITSAGVAATDELAEEIRFAEGAAAWERLLRRMPTVREQFEAAVPQLPFVHARRLHFHSRAITGKRWAMLPSAAGFIDPLLSTGFPLALLGVSRLAAAIECDWDSTRFEDRLKNYAELTSRELASAGQLISALYTSMGDFSLFASISLLYFAAASFTESVRRLGRPELAGAFLMHDHSVFGPGSRACLDRVSRELTPAQKTALMKDIQRIIEPFDVAGLSDCHRRNWYPVKAADLFGAADKLGVSRAEIENLLNRSSFFVPS